MRAPALAVLVILLAGCAGSGGSKPSAPPSRSAFVARANGICAAAKTRTERLAGLRRIHPPAGDENLYANWLKAEADALAAAEAVGDTSKPPEEDPLVPLAIAEGKIAGYARRLGAATCAAPEAGRMPP